MRGGSAIAISAPWCKAGECNFDFQTSQIIRNKPSERIPIGGNHEPANIDNRKMEGRISRHHLTPGFGPRWEAGRCTVSLSERKGNIPALKSSLGGIAISWQPVLALP